MRIWLPVVSLAAALAPSCDCGLEPLGRAPGSVAGVACDATTGDPLAVTEIIVESGDERATVSTDDDGHFFVAQVAAGPARVVLPGDRAVDVVIVPGETTELDDSACRLIPADAVGSLRGRVCNGHVGLVVAGADVLVLLPDQSRLESVTDENGEFFFTDVPVGTHALSIRGDGFSRSDAVTIERDTETVIDVGGACAIPAPTERGGVRGRVCTADGAHPLDEARASVTPTGLGEIFTLTNEEGRFELLDVPVGDQVLVIQKGTFRTERAVTIPANAVLQLDEEECALEPDDIRIAVVRGSNFDHVEQVLGSIGVPEANVEIFGSDWAEALLGPDERVRDYDVLFLNCRSAEPVYLSTSTMRDRMRSYIADGGSLFASDQAYDLIEGTFPDQIDFLGTDETRGAADRGAIVNDLSATIIDATMATLFGQPSATLRYPLETWSVMTGVASGVDVYLRADAPLIGGTTADNAPQIVGFSHGEGRVTYSSFHQEPGSHPDQLRILQLLMFEL